MKVKVTLEEVPSFPSVPRGLVEEKSWTTVRRGRFQRPENIMVLEGRAILRGLERRARDVREHGRRALHLADNQSFVLAAAKGRWSNWGSWVIIRQMASLSLATGIKLRLRWLEGPRNPADKPSRHLVGGVLRDALPAASLR